MRAVISGAQCTGKTTVLSALVEAQKSSPIERFKNCIVIREVVRDLIKEKNIQINQLADHESQSLILEQHYKNCLRNVDMITDRGSIDAFVYATHNYLTGKFTLEEHIEHEKLFLRSLPFYDVIFYIAPEFEMKEDGVRDTDKEYRDAICKIYNMVFQRYKAVLPAVYTLSGQVSERLNFVLRTLGPIFNVK